MEIRLESNSKLPVVGDELSIPAFLDAFQALASSAKQSFLKVERRQIYDESGSPYHDAYVKGDIGRALKLFREQFQLGSACEEDFCRRNVTSTRVRLIESPLTDYLKWELRTYPITASFGQRVLIRDITNEPDNGITKSSSDFLLFDNRTVLRHRYNPAGVLLGATLINDPKHVIQYVNFIHDSFKTSVSLGYFISSHPELFN